jgi:hypothetical protein
MCLNKWELVVTIVLGVDHHGDDKKLEGSRKQLFQIFNVCLWCFCVRLNVVILVS